jgi:hypothetical protein
MLKEKKRRRNSHEKRTREAVASVVLRQNCAEELVEKDWCFEEVNEKTTIKRGLNHQCCYSAGDLVKCRRRRK